MAQRVVPAAFRMKDEYLAGPASGRPLEMGDFSAMLEGEKWEKGSIFKSLYARPSSEKQTDCTYRRRRGRGAKRPKSR
jgi:hypothetical protein